MVLGLPISIHEMGSDNTLNEAKTMPTRSLVFASRHVQTSTQRTHPTTATKHQKRFHMANDVHVVESLSVFM